MFRDKLKELRKAFGVSQEELAIIIGLERSSIGKYESSKSSVMPSYDVLVRLAEYFRVSIDYLLENETYANYDSIAYRITAIAKYRKLAISDVAKKIGITYTELCNKLYQTPNSELANDGVFIKAIADVLNVDTRVFDGYNTYGNNSYKNYINFLLGKVDEGKPLTAEENSVLTAWLNDADDDEAEESIESLFERYGIRPMPAIKKVPLIGTIACGDPILAVENQGDEVDMPEHIRADFALLCKGDSMINARIHDGDIAYIREQPSVDNGQIAAVAIDDEVTLKRVYLSQDHITLVAENAKYQPLVYAGEDMNSVRILGLAIAFTSIIE